MTRARLAVAAAMIAASATLHAAESDPGAEFARAAGAAKEMLNAAVTELSALATAVEKGAVKDRAALESAFARAKQALDAARRDTPLPRPGPG